KREGWSGGGAASNDPLTWPAKCTIFVPIGQCTALLDIVDRHGCGRRSAVAGCMPPYASLRAAVSGTGFNGIQQDSTGLNGTELALNGTQLASNGIEPAPNRLQRASAGTSPALAG